jgi:hypothetical protein
MRRLFSLAVVLLCCCSTANADLILGDLALIGYKVTDGDEFSMVALNEIANGESFFFVDGTVDGISIDEAENVWRFDATSTISAGTVMTFTDGGAAWVPSTGGTVTGIATGVYSNGSIDANTGGFDDFLIFDSTDNALTEANSTNLFFLDSADNGANVPRDLTAASGIVDRDSPALTGIDHVRYNGPISGDAATLFAAISDDSNWEHIASTVAGSTVAPSIVTNGGFSVDSAAVPEPGSFAALSLLCGLGLYQRRRNAA